MKQGDKILHDANHSLFKLKNTMTKLKQSSMTINEIKPFLPFFMEGMISDWITSCKEHSTNVYISPRNEYIAKKIQNKTNLIDSNQSAE